MKNTLRSFASLALAIVCLVASISPVQTQAAVIDKTIDFSVASDDTLFQGAYLDWVISEGGYKADAAWASTYLKEAFDLSKDLEIKLEFKLPVEDDAAHHFKVGLVNVDTSNHAISAGATAHFYKHPQWGDIATLNSTFDSAGASWYADIATNYYDGNVHTMTITVTDGKAVFKVDETPFANQSFASADLGTEPVYLAFQSANANCFIDNITIDLEDVKEYPTLNLGFSDAADGEKFSTTWQGWKIENQEFVPNGEWANAYLDGVIPLNQDKEISFTFTLPVDASTGHEFRFGLVDMSTGAANGGVTAHFRNNGSLEIVTLNSDFNGAGNGIWYADHIGNYFDGQPHTMTIVVQNKVATYKIDGIDMATTQEFSGANVGKDAVSIMFTSSLAGASIDDIVVKDYVPTSPDPGPDVNPNPDPNPNPEQQQPTYHEMSVDFSNIEDAEDFTTTWQGWSVADGVYKPNAEWANTYTSFKIPLNEDKEISFDFCMKNNGDKSHQFNFGFVDVQGTQFITDVAAHFYYSSQWNMELFTLNQDMSNPIGEGWIADYTENFNDGNVHRMLIAVKDQKACFYIDGNMIFKDVSLKNAENYFLMQYTDTESFIDNFKLSDTLSVNSYEGEVQSPSKPGAATTPSAKPYAYKEMNLKFDSAKDEEAFASTYEGWAVSEGVYKANTAWANTYVNCEIPLNEDKEISFDFCLMNDGDKNHQFNIGFVWMNGSEVKTGLAGHFYQHAQYGELFSLNRDFGNPIGEGWIADNTDNYNDGEVHAMMIRVQDGNATFYIDGILVFENIAVNMKDAYFIMQCTDTASYIDNFRVSDTLTYIPDYPVSTPDPTGDETVENVVSENSLVAAKGKVVRAAIGQKAGLSPNLLAAIIAGGIIVVAVTAGCIVFCVKKRKRGE